MDSFRRWHVCLLFSWFLGLAWNGSAQGQESPASLVEVRSPVSHSGKLTLTAKVETNPFSNKNQQPPSTQRVDFKPGEVLEIVLSGLPAKGFHTYPATVRTSLQDEAMLSSLEFSSQGNLFPVWPINETTPETVREEALGGNILEFPTAFQWSVPLVIDPALKGPIAKQTLKVRLQVCDEKGCHWGDHLIEIRLPVSGPPIPVTDEPYPKSVTPAPSPKVVTIPGGKEEANGSNATKPGSGKRASMAVTRIPQLPEKESFKEVARYPEGTIHDLDGFKAFLRDRTGPESELQDSGLLEFMLLGMFWGGISLVTPCVFPMIPVTVSIFLKQKESGGLSPLTKALIYCGTITVVLTLAAVMALSLFVWLSINWVFNTFMGLLFIFFALSLFGMYDIELPSWLTTWSSQNEQKGGVTGTVFMALTFSMLSFACVAPFLGGFGANSAGRPFFHQLLGGLAFSATFAAPFFLLALFPGLLRSLPRSGTWLNTIKVAMGFVELMAAIKFFRLAEIREGTATWFTYDFCLAATVAILVAGAFYLFQFFRLPLDTEQDHLSVPRMTFGIAFLTLALYLFPGLLHPGQLGRNRPQGVVYAWMDSFLLPDNEPAGNGTQSGEELPWTGDLANALAAAKQDGKAVFVDFTGVTCTNCKLNEKQVFSRPEVQSLFANYHLVQLYTDRVIPEFIPEGEIQKDKNLPKDLAEANSRFRNEQFKVEQLPFYVIIEPR